MPSVGVKLYSVFFKLLLKHRLYNQAQVTDHEGHGITSRSGSSTAPASAAFIDGIATKDIHINTLTNLSIRIFLPESSLPSNSSPSGPFGNSMKDADRTEELDASINYRRSSYGGAVESSSEQINNNSNRRSSYGGIGEKDRGFMLVPNGVEAAGKDKRVGVPNYRGYLPANSQPLHRKLPIIFQFHGGGFVAGSKDSAANDFFCRRMAKLCDAIVIAVGYRLAPENRYPTAFEDGFEAVKWLAKQANLAECSKSLVQGIHRADGHREIVDNFGASVVEPWLAAHGDPSRCVLLGVSSGANIADHVARKAVQAGKLLEPVKVVSQVLLYPFFIGSTPTHSEIKLANSYFYDKDTCILAWKLFLPEGEFSFDHVAANPLIPGREPPFKLMPPTLTVVAELDWMRDRAIAYSEALRKVKIDAPVLEYKDAVHEFATLDILLKSRQAEACAEDIAIWVKKYISLKGHEFSY
ncbi:hypothetical protein KI387_013180 [Taxus chinensis]|uniref:Alpha/beta hydrolase fold-3 domain-containing protein n=1 Tax=Taxus chinensis TaxID=29808 RepID=A0AA38CQ90_TAXCH|nr:hypothetical protein KI387_013180 [Taxus chinensis]